MRRPWPAGPGEGAIVPEGARLAIEGTVRESSPRRRPAAERGDSRWQAMLADHHRIVRRQLDRFGGTEVEVVGDGFLATFDGPARAVRCAVAIRDEVKALELEIRPAACR